MKKLILLASVAGLFGCQHEARQDYEIQCLSARTTALTTDVSHLISVVNLNTGTLTLSSGTMVVPTSPVLPPTVTTSTGEGWIDQVLTVAKTGVQASAPFLPAGVGLLALAILSSLSGLFKKKE
jgi:hypothetical protein